MEQRLKLDVLLEVGREGVYGEKKGCYKCHFRVAAPCNPLCDLPTPLSPQALKYGGRILVAQESFEETHYNELFDIWEEIDHPDAVQTTAEVSWWGWGRGQSGWGGCAN